ncbi:MAG TPA: cyclase family protein [Chthoniobacterales bacterium]|nr:cyclase family protein [Chthoniobacterales bacterium]
MRTIWDISRPLTNDLAPWPGDSPFRYELKWYLSETCSVNVGTVTMSVHNGTHADAPFHFSQKGDAIDSVPLENYIGPAIVIDLAEIFSRTQPFVAIAHLQHARSQIEETRRILLKTNCFPDSRRFPDWIPVLKAETIAWLRELRVILLGVDLPSVDPIEATILANHYALAAGNIAILESLDLSGLEAGVYQFAALPLKVVGGDAAPVRAVLWRD